MQPPLPPVKEVNYERLSLKIAQYAKDIVDLMIQNKWLEQQTGSVNKFV
ncbi:hypothetical protein ACERJO_14335 [Halalkalibacter sp. AB-rgal2]